MNVLSLFDGMSCGMIALERAGLPVTNYYASEIDKYAIKISEKNYPSIIRLGDVRDISGEDLPQIDLLLAGSPCQGFSFAGRQLAFDDPRSALFFEFVRILKEVKPKYFLLENVKMKKEFQDIITEQVKYEPIEINSALVSAQNRKRLYWTNIPSIEQPKNNGLLLRDILQSEVPEKFYLSKKIVNGSLRGKGEWSGRFKPHGPEEKSQCLNARYYKLGKQDPYINTKKIVNINPSGRGMNGWVYDANSICPTLTTNKGEGLKISEDKTLIRKLTPVECERLQTVPDNYTELNEVIGKCYANRTAAIEKQELRNLVTTVYSTIKELKGTETLQLSKIIGNIEKLNVTIAEESRLLEVCVIGTTRTGEGTETLNTQIRLEKNSAQEAIKKEEMANLYTELLSKNILEENLSPMRLCIILIVIKSITQLKTFMFAKGNQSTQFSIDNLRLSQGGSLKWDISNLKTENIKSIVSNTQRYKMLGNGWTVDVIAHILKHIPDH